MENSNAQKTYAQLLKAITAESVTTASELTDIINEFKFSSSTELMFRQAPLAVSYSQLPLILDSNLLIKVVLIKQAENAALIMPKNVIDINDTLEENPELIIDKNVNLDLYAEVFGFDTSDSSFKETIKNAYLGAGSSLRAFEFKNSKKAEPEKDELESRPEDEKPDGIGLPKKEPGEFKPPLDKIPGDTPVEDAIAANKESFSKFKKTGSYLEALLEKLAGSMPSAIKKNVKYNFLTENNSVLIIEVDNRAIIEKFTNAQTSAKQALSSLGESIRNDSKTQMIDSFIANGKRYHILVEAVGNNFWYVEGEDLLDTKVLTETSQSLISPIQEDIVVLKKSSIRQESRKRIPLKNEKEIMFIGGIQWKIDSL